MISSNKSELEEEEKKKCTFALGDLVAFNCHKSFSSLLSFFLLCAGEHKRHRLSAICIPETHEANLHKSPAIMHAL